MNKEELVEMWNELKEIDKIQKYGIVTSQDGKETLKRNIQSMKNKIERAMEEK